MQRVFVLDVNLNPFCPCKPARARYLLKIGRAAVFRRYPFTIILKDRGLEESVVQDYRLKIDPGAKTTGIAIMNDSTGEVVWAAELTHRGFQIRDNLTKRRSLRRGRRNRHTRYRAPRFNNRRRPSGWLPPSLMSRLYNIITWVGRLQRYCPIVTISQELVRFDTQAMQNPEIKGIEYQQGTLAGYELREYLLEKWHRKCAYCGESGIPLQIEHIKPKSKGGSNRVSNLTLACAVCNQDKGNRDIKDFLSDKPDALKKILEQAKKPLSDASAVNTTRWALYHRFVATGLPVEVGTGGRTKWNRIQRNLPKTHWTDAACVGASTPEELKIEKVQPLLIVAAGHGNRLFCRMDSHGFPLKKKDGSLAAPKPKQKKHFGFQTGDLVRAVVTKGKKKGVYVGRVACRSSGSFNIQTGTKVIQGISHRYCQGIHLNDGYNYSIGVKMEPLSSKTEIASSQINSVPSPQPHEWVQLSLFD